MVITSPADGWDQQDLKMEQQADNLGPLMQGIGTWRRPEWRDINNRYPIYNFWAKCKSLALMNVVLVRHCESADGKKTAQEVVPQRKVDDILTDLHGGTSGGRLGAYKTMDKIRQRYYC